MTIKIRNIFLSILAFLSLLTFATPAYADYGQWGVNNPSSAGEIQTIPEGYGLTAIGYGSDDHKCVIGIQTAPINADGSVDFRFADFTWRMTYCSAGAPDSGRSANIKYFNPVSGDIVTGWTWGADTSGGKPGNNDSPPDECFYQEYINLQTKLIGSQYNGSCSSRGYNVPGELKAVARAPSGRVITGIYFNLDDDAKLDFLAMTTRTVKTASLAVSTNSLIQNQFDLSPSAPTGSGVISNVNTTNGGSFTITDCPYISETLFKYSISIQCPIGQSVTTNKPFSVSVICNPGTSGSATFQVQATGENATVVNPSSETVTVNYVVSSQPQTPVTPVNGTCQKPPDGAILSSAPSGTICETGTASSVSGSGPWNWTCAGSNGGANAQCSAQPTATTCQLTASGASNNAKTITEGESVYWAVSSVPSGLPYFWYVSGSSIQNDVPGEWGGRTDTSGTYTYNTRCTYDVYFNVKNTNGAVTCTSNKVTLTVKPKIVVQPLPPPPPPPPTGLSCSPATQTDRSSPYEFSFKASGGSNNSLYSWTNNNICTVLSNNGESYSIRCSPISNGEATVTAGSETARCCFGAGFDAQCEEEETPTPPLDGVCGTANKTYPTGSTSYGYDSYCSPGIPSATPNFPPPGNSVSWFCGGINGGTTSGSCTASVPTLPMSGTLAPTNPPGLSSCVIASGASTCNINFSWTTTNPISISSVARNPSAGFNPPLANFGTNVPFAVPYDRATFFLYNNNTKLAESAVTASCISGTAWNQAYGRCMVPVPVAPSNLQASNAVCGKINLIWRDNSNNETGFRVYRSRSQIFGREYATVGANVTSYTDTNPMRAADNYYVITSYNSGGEGYGNATFITPTDCMSGWLDPSISCTISAGQNSCNANLSWNINNPESAPTAITANGMSNINVSNSLSTYQSGTQAVPVPKAGRTFYLYNNAKTLAQSTAISSCALGNVWVSGACRLIVNGSCGTANKTYPAGSTSYGSDTYCNSGNPSSTPAFPSAGQSSNWTCNGTGGGTNSGQCAASVPVSQYSLNVTKTTGGSVASADGFIICGSACSHNYAKDSSVTLTATPTSSYWRFIGWTGNCTGTLSCVLNINSDKTVNATFGPRTLNYQEF